MLILKSIRFMNKKQDSMTLSSFIKVFKKKKKKLNLYIIDLSLSLYMIYVFFEIFKLLCTIYLKIF